MLNTVVVSFALAAATAPPTKAGVVYRFETGPRNGTVWVAGSNARMEYDARENLPARVEIWKDGGKQVLVLNDGDRTYYDLVAYRAKFKQTSASVDAMTVGQPFEIAEVQTIRVDVRPQSGPSTSESCRPVTVAFSYDLRLRIAVAPGTFPGRVEGVAEFCLAESFPITLLPFGHGSMLTAGIEAVDKAFAERLAPLTGVPVRRKISATRRIENGETVSRTSTIELKDVHSADIPAGRLEVPSGYRFQEPVVVAPMRQD